MPDRTPERPLILIIEDNPNDLRLLSSLVKDQGDIIFSTSGSEGIQQASQRAPDLILLDVELPDMDGYSVCKEIKSMEVLCEIPVIFVTGHQSAHHEVSALESGAIDFITKPFNPPIICARVKTHLTLKKQSDILHSLAEKDGLTDVYNRRYFDARANSEWTRHQRQNQPLAIALLDVDHFKLYNDHYGHIQGDQCLKLLAKTLKNCTRRAGEFVSRYGGEEFICLLPNTNDTEALKIGEYICEKLSSLKIPHAASKTADSVTVSVGVAAMHPNPELSLDDLISRADQGLYQAKDHGRNCCRLGTDLSGTTQVP